MSLVATVIIPTSIDRGPCLRLAVESVLRQTVRELEVFIIGDGVAENTREVAQALALDDPRVRFFDHPKHPRRGEPYRDAALREARGRIVCYLCDRDLYLPWHVEELDRLLRDADMAHTGIIRLAEEGYVLDQDFNYELQDSDDRARLTHAGGIVPLPLSFGAHTLEAYRKLPEGWTVTPTGFFTDSYFWTKFAARPELRTTSGLRPSVLYFPRGGGHPGWSTARRLPELEAWAARIQSTDTLWKIEIEMNNAVRHDRVLLGRQLRQARLSSPTPTPTPHPQPPRRPPWHKKLYRLLRPKRV